ncbi:MAG: hypothetical protein K2K96_13170 [Lachnospiraceae bacterium]|nr:hypothetical protein [Lachnospiraceae bacterium]
MKAVRKRVYISIIASLMACLMFVMPVMAAGSSYKSMTTVKLNAMNGNISQKSQVGAGSYLGTTRSITKVEIYVNVDRNSDPFIVHVISPEGTHYSFEPSTTTNKTYTTTIFNGEDPEGKWTVYIENEGISYKPNQIYPTSTATITVKPYYNWS